MTADRHSVLDQTCDRVHTYGEGEAAEEFGGQYLDLEAEFVHCLFTDRLDWHRARLLALGCPPEMLALRKVQYSLRTLNAVHEAVARDISMLRDRGIIVFGIGADVERNVVEIIVEELTDVTKRTLDELYGERMIRVVPAHGIPMPSTGRSE